MHISIDGGREHVIEAATWTADYDKYLTEADLGALWHHVPLAPVLVVESESRWFDDLDEGREFDYHIRWTTEAADFAMSGTAYLDHINAKIQSIYPVQSIIDGYPVRNEYTATLVPVKKDGSYANVKRMEDVK